MNAHLSSDQAIDAQLQQALGLHRAKQYEEAEQAYLAILAARRYHPVANHNLGLLHGQQGRHQAALPYFQSAWSINPDEGQFWLSYADGLLKAEQAAQALEIVEGALARGLDNEATRTLLDRAQSALDEQRSRNPTPDEEAQLVALYQAGHYPELEQAARLLLDKHPESAFAASVLGTALQLQGKDALAVLRRTVELAPHDAEAHGSLGNALQGAGEYHAAIASYQQALALQPEFAEAHSNLGGALQALGQLKQAADSYRRALAVRPDYAVAHFNLGNTLLALGDAAGAAQSYRRTAELAPHDAGVHYSLGQALDAAAQHHDAAAAFRRALELHPAYLEALTGLANSLLAAGDLEQASVHYQQALALQPDSAEAHFRAGLSLQMQEQYVLALAPLARAVELDPHSIQACAWLAHTQHAAGHAALAAETYRAALALNPDDAALHNQLGIALHDSGDSEAALDAYRQALALQPDLAQAHGNIGVAQHALQRYDAACASYRQALAIDPQFAVAHVNLGISLRSMHKLEEAAEQFRLARDMRPDYLDAHINLCAALSELGELAMAVDACYAALAVNPDYMLVHSNLLFCLSHLATTDPDDLYREHLRFASQFETPFLDQWQQHDNARDPQRVLRVGFVSGDFNRHAVANFVIPIFEHLCRSPRLSLYAYYVNSQHDEATARVRACMANWRQADQLSDEQLAQQIRDDGIDVLIDLSGHTDKNRLMTFARKPAPLQATWIGYPGTTGLKAIDYFLTDRHLMPAEFASQYSEQFAYLPASAPFLPSAEAPPVNPLPALNNGHITFGSFNRPNKLSREVIALWAKLLHAVPGSRLLLGAMPLSGDHDVFIEWFAGEGIGLERLSFAPRGPMKDYLALHHQVDICLDTFPYTGGTTTLHGLWMGVPMLTLAGATMPGRVSAAVLEHLQLDAMIAHDSADFVQKGVYLANALPLLSTLRASMRELLARSALGQPGVIAVGLEGALRAMWQRWCDGLPAASFEVELDPDYAGQQEA
jgi:predicted O-linked N-acetylglucosamine transferase (SPINDLY family)